MRSALFLSLTALWLQLPQLEFRPEGVKPIIENERVTVWDVRAPIRSHGETSIVVAIAPPSVAGKVFAGRAAPAADRAIIIDLKDHRVPPLQNKSGYPNAFPRPGNVKVLENDRIVVWDYTWTAGVPTPMHFHDKDVVVVYLEEGALRSTTPDGQSTVNELSPGMTRFNPRDRVHTEQLVRGKSRAIITELK